MRKYDAGDFQVQRADANAFAPKSQEQIRSLTVPREHRPRCEEFDSPLQPFRRENLAVGVVEPVDFCEPASQLLLHRDDRGKGGLLRFANVLKQFQAEFRSWRQRRNVVCVKNQQALSRKFAVCGIRVRAVRLRASFVIPRFLYFRALGRV